MTAFRLMDTSGPFMATRASSSVRYGETIVWIRMDRVVARSHFSPPEAMSGRVSSCARARAASLPPDCVGQVCRRAGRARAERHHAACDGEQVFHAVIHLLDEEILSLLRASALGNVAGDFRGADGPAFSIFDWRHRERNLDQAAVFALANRFVILDALAPADSPKDFGLLVATIWWNEDSDRLADKFLGGIPEEALGARIRSDDKAIEILAQNSVVPRDSTIATSRCALYSTPLRLVISTKVFTAPVSLPASSNTGVGYARNGMRVPSGRSANASRAADRSFFFQRYGHGALVVRHRPAVRPIQPP